jgi:Zn-dependent protease with chaperone function
MVAPQIAPARAAERPDPYTPHLPPRAHAYFRAHRVLLFVRIGWHVLGLWLLLRSGLSARIRDGVERILRIRREQPDAANGRNRIGAPPFRAVAAYYMLYTLLSLLWSLPMGLRGLAIEYQFGFSHQTLGSFLQDELLSLAVGWTLIPVVWLAYRLYVWTPSRWWLWVWAAIVPLSFFVMVVYPLVVSPLFNRYTPLAPGPLRDHILALAARSGITGGRVFVEDTSRRTTHVNAYVIGIGPSTRIVLNDTALQQLPEDQILAMMGHEMGHYVERHIWIGLAAGALGSGLLLWLMAILLPALARRYGSGWGLRGLQDLAALPLVLLVLYLLTLLGEPLGNAVSRELEHRADAFGLRVTGLNDATARLMVGFAERDFSDPDPPRLLHLWFGTHPTLKERIAFALQEEKQRRKDSPTPAP